MGMSQEQFAKHIGKSYGMVQRYEQKRAPAGSALLPFVDLAERGGHHDLVSVFRAGMVRQLVQNSTVPRQLESSVLSRILQEQSSDEVTLISLWLLCLRTLPSDSLRVLTSVMLAELLLNKVPEQLQREMEAVLEGFKSGQTIEEIASRLNGSQTQQR